MRTRKPAVKLGLGAPAVGSPAKTPFGLMRRFVTLGSTPLAFGTGV
jgi:hypothetical protein